MNPAPAQVTYTSNAFLSPEFIGGLATMIALLAGRMGVQVLADPANQQLLVMLVGMVMTGVAHFLFPSASGKLGLTAPAPWSTPTAQDIPPGTSVVAVPESTDTQQTTSVVPLSVGAHRVEVSLPPLPPPPPPPPPPLPPTVTVTPIPANASGAAPAPSFSQGVTL